VLLVRADAELVPWPLACLGTAYAVALVVAGRAVDNAAPLVAVGLLLCGELAAWSIDERLRIPEERAVVRARALALAALALGSLAVASSQFARPSPVRSSIILGRTSFTSANATRPSHSEGRSRRTATRCARAITGSSDQDALPMLIESALTTGWRDTSTCRSPSILIDRPTFALT